MPKLLRNSGDLWLVLCCLCLGPPLYGSDKRVLDADQMRLLDRRIHQDFDVLTHSEYDVVLSTLFDKQVDAEQVDELYAFAFLSLIRDAVPKRVTIAAKYAEQCGEIVPDSDRHPLARRLGVMLQVLRFDAPEDGAELEAKFWKHSDDLDEESQKACLQALQFVSWQADSCLSMREKHLVTWFERPISDEVRLEIVGCVSGATVSGKCHPYMALRIYRAVLEAESATPKHAGAVLSQIQEWFAEMQLRAIFSGMSDIHGEQADHKKE